MRLTHIGGFTRVSALFAALVILGVMVGPGHVARAASVHPDIGGGLWVIGLSGALFVACGAGVMSYLCRASADD